jgi:hypothetical protein
MDVPWTFLSLIIFVVVGPTYTILTNPETNIVAKGAKTLHLFDSANVPDKLDATPNGLRDPGYVKARTTGKAVCKPKYIGKIFC